MPLQTLLLARSRSGVDVIGGIDIRDTPQQHHHHNHHQQKQQPRDGDYHRGNCGAAAEGAPRVLRRANSYEDDSGHSDSGEEKMYGEPSPREPVRSYGTHVSASPMSRKQAILQRQSLEKYANVSDGESDSGSSTLTEARHELAPELEYSWDCPSGLSLLLELMTQSPHRHSGRDIAEAGGDGKSPETHINRSDTSSYHAKDLSEKSSLYSRVAEVKEMRAPLPDSVKYDLTAEKGYTAFEDATLDGNRSSGQADNRPSPADAHHMTVACGSAGSRAAVEYDYADHHQQDHKFHYAQRKITFEAGNCAEDKELYPSSLDEPIDYSQLSSRRREQLCQNSQLSSRRREQLCQNLQPKREPEDLSTRSRECDEEGERLAKIRKVEHEATRVSEKTAPAAIPKYEFILSPKMDTNGNLILHQPKNSAYSMAATVDPNNLQENLSEKAQCLTSVIFSPREIKREFINSASQQCLPSTSPVSNAVQNDGRQPFSEIAPVQQESCKYSSEKHGMTYHPKLKYLMAATQYAKSKAKQEEVEQESKTSVCSQPSVLFSQDRPAQSQKSVQLLPQVDSCASGDSPQSFPPGEYFQHNKILSTNVFILNAGSSFITSEAPIGSLLNQQQQQQQNHIIEVHPHQLSPTSAIHISGQVIGSSDIIVQEQYQNEEPVSPCPGDQQPLSPATLRDQQSTLSELLFSNSRKAGIDPYACADCGKRYSTSSNLARHRQTHRSVCDKKARKCPHCEKVYVSMPAYSMHVRTHNQGCECPHCGKKFSRPWLLQGHIRTHTGEKPFGCPQCGKSFADKSNLRAHIQTHSTDKPYVCGRCGKAFALKSYLYKHEESSCMRGQRFRS